MRGDPEFLIRDFMTGSQHMTATFSFFQDINAVTVNNSKSHPQWDKLQPSGDLLFER